MYILLHFKCHSTPMSNLHRMRLFLIQRGKRDLETEINDWDLRFESEETTLPVRYGVATISRLLKMIGFFCGIQSLI